jgi:hypothetical protein
MPLFMNHEHLNDKKCKFGAWIKMQRYLNP